MRTTIRIDDQLYRELKASAARSGRTVAAVLEDAVRRGLRSDKPPSMPRYVVRALGEGGLRPGVDLESNAGLIEALDEGTSIDALH